MAQSWPDVVPSGLPFVRTLRTSLSPLRHSLTDTDAELLRTLESLVDPVTRGDPMSPLRWTCKSTRKLSEELHRQKHPVGPRTVAKTVMVQEIVSQRPIRVELLVLQGKPEIKRII